VLRGRDVARLDASQFATRHHGGHRSTQVTNWFRTVSIPWRDVERCGYDDGLWIHVRGGRMVRASAFANGPRAMEWARTPGRNAALRLVEIRKRRNRRR
jgi:hypothetical protein